MIKFNLSRQLDPQEVVAYEFAKRHHRAVGQLVPYTHEPYIAHPSEVVDVLMTVPHTMAMRRAAWAHDTIEDTDATEEDARRELGDEAAALVLMLTKVSKPTDGNRATRAAIDRAHCACATPEAKTVKLADIVVTTRSIVERNPVFARTYLPEKALQIEVLTQGDPTLLKLARSHVRSGMASLGIELPGAVRSELEAEIADGEGESGESRPGFPVIGG